MNRKCNGAALMAHLSKKTLLLTVALTLALSGIIGGTLAWLIDATPEVKNTFTYGDININLDETDTGDDDGLPNTNTYQMMPGKIIHKDPKVTVMGGSENCWLFVELVKSENFDQFLEYAMAAEWIALDAVLYPGVYYRPVDQQAEDQVFPVLLGDQVLVKASVTKAMLDGLVNAETGVASYPTLSLTGYAVQRDEAIDAIDTAEDAWALVLQEKAAAAVVQPTTP